MLFRKPAPLKPFYKRQPVATVAVILTMVAMFVLAPVGVIYDGLTEELKGKADNATVILLIQQIKENDNRQWKEIENNRKQHQVALQAPKNLQMKTVRVKVILTPDEFEKYMNMTSESRVAYKKYLENTGKDVRGLP